MKKYDWLRIFTGCFLIGCFLMPTTLLEGRSLTGERAADIAAADAQYWCRDELMLYADKIEKIPSGYRIKLRRKTEKEASPFAVYEIDSSSGKVLQREFSQPGFQNFAEIAKQSDEERAGGIAVHGVLRNIPGYILDSPNFLSSFFIWAEANGRVVATQTSLLGTTVYQLSGIPVTAGTVAIKAKIRGYDLTTLHPGVVLNPAQPIGIIAGVDIDFHQIRPICRDVRIIVQSNGEETSPSFPAGARVRVICRETGQSAEAVSANGWAEVVIPDVPTGWQLRFFAINLNAGYHNGELGPIVIPEDGGTSYTDTIVLN